MSTETAGEPGVVRTHLSRLSIALRGTLGRRDGRIAFAMGLIGYFLVYEVAVQNLARAINPGTFGVSVADNPLDLAFRSTGPFQYEPIAFVQLYVVDYLFAPVTAAIGLGLAVLVAANLAIAYVSWRAPTACGIDRGRSSSAGLLASLPALLSGTVCCGPVLLLIVGIQATAGLMALFQWLLPIAVLLLVGSLFWASKGVSVDAAM